MSQVDLVIRGRRVVFAEHVAPASIHIQNERIIRIAEFDEISSHAELIEADHDSIVMAGLVIPTFISTNLVEANGKVFIRPHKHPRQVVLPRSSTCR